MWKQKGEGKMKTTKAQLVDELARLRQRVSELEASETARKQAEEVLRELEERYRLLFEQAADSIIVVDVDSGELVDFNERAHMNLGYSREEFQRLRIADFEVIESEEEVAKHTRRISKKGTALFETKHRTKSGDIRDVEVTARALSASGRNMVQSILRDITERKQAEEMLRQSEERYRTILDQIEEAYYEQDLAGNFTFVNNALCRRLEYCREELIGLNYRAYIPEKDVRSVYETWNKVYRTGKPLKWQVQENVTKDGRRVFVENCVSPLWNEAGEIIAFRGVSRDITERKQAEEALRQSEERYRTILEEMEEGYHELDLNGNLAFFNDSMCRMLGYSRKEMMGMNYRACTPPEDVKAVFKDYNRVYRTGKPMKALSYKTIRKDGSAAFAEVSIFPLRNNDGEVVGFRGIRRDITERKQMEEALRQSEERYRTILEEMEDSYFEVDLAGNYTFVNDANCRALGCSREELLGAGYRPYMAEEDAKTVFKAFLQVYRTGEPNRGLSYRVVRKDGSTGFSQLSAFPLRNREGEIIGFRGIGRDITERKQAEEVLRQSEERYRTILEEIEDSYFELDLAGNYTFVNDANCRALGCSREELLGAGYRPYMAEEDAKAIFKAFNQVYRTGKPNKGLSYRVIRKDGSAAFGELSAFPLRNREGEIIGFRGVGSDITERKQMEEALRQSEERYRLLAENAKDAIWTVDMNMRPTFMGPSITSLLGYSVEEAMVKSMEEVYTPASLEIAMKLLAQELARENMEHKDLSRSRVLEFELIHKDGSIVPIEGKFSFIRGPDAQPVEILAIARDITERKQMEEEKKELEQKAQIESRLASLGLLASGVGHEINNPLTGVIGYAQLLLGRDIPQDIRKDVESINKEAQRVANIVKKLVAFARYQKPQRTYAGISDIVAGTVDLLAHQLEISNIQTNLHLDPNLPWTIADIGQLQQVFLNIIINAETEMRLAHGKGKLSIKTEKTDNTIRVSFKDDGLGIAKENLEKIFDPFFTTREVGEGTGLGLSICHEIIAEHGGSIYAESKSGKGATFIVELPVVAEEKHPQAAKPVAEEAARAAGARILVVDDERLILDFVSRVLTDEGHEVEIVDNAADALRKIESERYSLILLDIKMPGMSGIELYNHLKKTAQSLARRVVFITGDVMGAETTAFLFRIKAPRIDKPFDAEQLKSEINRILARGRS